MTVLAGSGGVLDNDTDPDGDVLEAVLVSTTSNGTLVLGPDGGFTDPPNTGDFGPDSFTYAADNGTALSDNTASINVVAAASPSPSATPPASESSSEFATESASASASESASVSPSSSESASPVGTGFPSAGSSASASIAASPSSSTSASASASTSPSASPSPAVGSPALDAVVLEAFIEQDDAQAGETVYTDEATVGTTAAGDRRPATEGELTCVVVDSATNTVLDQGSTDADGIVVLDAETGALFFIYKVAEPDGTFYGSPDFLLIGDETLDVEVTRSVAIQPASASLVASGSAAASTVPRASATSSASPAPSAAVSDDGTTMPSAAPSGSSVGGTSALPNTGVGTGPPAGGRGSMLWLALLGTALARVGAAGLRAGRR